MAGKGDGGSAAWTRPVEGEEEPTRLLELNGVPIFQEGEKKAGANPQNMANR